MRTPSRIENMTLVDAWSQYIKAITLSNYSPDTIEKKIYHFRLFLEYLPNGILAKEVTQKHIDKFIVQKQKTVSAASLNSYLRVYRAFFYWMERRGYITSKLHFSMQKEQQKVPKSYTPEEIRILLKKPNTKTCTFNEYRDWAIINFIMATGARRTTIVELNIEDIHFEEGFIEANKTKNNQGQILPLSSSLNEVLTEYLMYREGKPSDPLFCLDNGDRMRKDYLTKEIAKYNKRRGIEKTSIHALRHTFSKSAIMECHMDVFQLKKILGHTDIKTTENYVRLFDKDILQNVDESNPLNFYTTKKKRKIKMG